MLQHRLSEAMLTIARLGMNFLRASLVRRLRILKRLALLSGEPAQQPNPQVYISVPNHKPAASLQTCLSACIFSLSAHSVSIRTRPALWLVLLNVACRSTAVNHLHIATETAGTKCLATQLACTSTDVVFLHCGVMSVSLMCHMPNSGTPTVPRRIPHSHPGLKPVPLQANPNQRQRTPSHHRRSMQNSQLASDADSAKQTLPKQGRTAPRSGSRHQPATQSASSMTGQLPPSDSPEQPSQAPQDSGDSEATQSTQRGPQGSTWQPLMSLLGSPAVNQPAGAVGADRGGAADGSPSTSATSTSHPAPLGFPNPTSDGRTVVVTGFRKGMAGPEAKQMALDMCAQFGGISACWLRKGKSSCWFVIIHFTEVIPVLFKSACLMRP